MSSSNENAQETTTTTTTTSSSSMAPPPNRAPATKTTTTTTTTIAAAPTTTRHMNDTTMPPPLRYNNNSSNNNNNNNYKVSNRKTAVNVRARGPRFGLHDWKRLLASAKDLAQRKGAPLRRDIPLAEVKQHNKVHDGWIILRGKVYNLGPYLAYHPGGIDILKGILGKDATRLFDKYHRWVNIDGLIGPLLLGTVATTVMDTKPNPFSVVPPNESHLTNAPRVSAQAASGTSLLADNDDDDDSDNDDDDDELMFSNTS